MPSGILPPVVPSDPARQAVASLDGYAYQIWRTVLEWLLLKDAAELELEGNEDIDLLRPGIATSVQVKNTAGSGGITLRSGDVVDAINNFWRARAKNPSIDLSVRFLSTSGSTFEKERPFGALHGLQVWRAAQRRLQPETDLEATVQIRAFLTLLPSIDTDLKSWLNQSQPQVVLTDLLCKIHWDLDAESTEDVKTIIDRQLVLLGERWGVFPGDAKKVRGRLLETALAKATDKSDRRLRRSDLLEIFQEEVAVVVPKRMSELVRAGATLPTNYPSPDLPATTVLQALRRRQVGTPSTFLPRRAASQRIQQIAATRGFAYVNGSSGLGKSTLIQLAVSRSSSIFWLDLRGFKGPVAALLRLALDEILKEEPATCVVLDDLTFTGDSRPLQAALQLIYSTVVPRGGLLLASGSGGLPQGLLNMLSLDNTCLVEAPRLDSAEVDELLLLNGLGDEKRREAWTKVIYAHTGGHPQLVYARVAGLKQRGFPDLEAEDVLKEPKEVRDTKQEWQNIVMELPQGDRELLYRLSLTTSRFRKAVVFALAKQTPAINECGNVFARLVGPWIERVGDDQYRVSPLVQNAGGEAHGSEWAAQMHVACARALFSKKIAPDEASAILLHAIVGKDEKSLFRMSAGLVMSGSVPKGVSGWLGWFVHVDPSSIVSKRSGRVMVRLAQLLIAADRGPKEAAAAVARLDGESRLSSHPSDEDRISRLMALGKLLMMADVPLTPEQIVTFVVEIVTLAPDTAAIAKRFNRPPKESAGIDQAFSSVWLLALAMQPRISNGGEFLALLKAVAGVDVSRRAKVLGRFLDDVSATQHFVNHVWLTEWKSGQPDWASLVANLEESLRLASHMGAYGLEVALATVIVRTRNENLKEHLQARQRAEQFIEKLDGHPHLVDALADTYDWTGDYESAKKLRLSAVEKWPTSEMDPLAPITGRRKAAISSIKAGDHDVASKLLAGAASQTRQQDRSLRTGLLIDAGYEAIQASQLETGIDLLWQGLRELKQIPNTPGQPASFRVHKIAGHVLLVLAQRAEGFRPTGAYNDVVPPACCSDVDVQTEMLKLRATPFEGSELNLCRFCVRSSQMSPSVTQALERLRSTDLTLFRCMAANAELDVTTRSDRWVDVPVRALAFVRVARRTKELAADAWHRSVPSEDRTASWDLPLFQTLVASSLVMLSEVHQPSEVVDKWVKTFVDPQFSNEAREWIERVRVMMAKPLADRIAQDRKPLSWIDIVFLELSVAKDPDASTQAVLRAHVYMVYVLLKRDLRAEAGRVLSGEIATYWLQRAENAFELVSPRISQPALREACASEDAPQQKLAKVLLAASFAVGLTLPTYMAMIFVRAAQGEVEKPVESAE